MQEQDNWPRIMIEPMYRRDDEAKMVAVRTTRFIPGMVIERCGRRYVVDAKGTQKRIG